MILFSNLDGPGTQSSFFRALLLPARVAHLEKFPSSRRAPAYHGAARPASAHLDLPQRPLSARHLPLRWMSVSTLHLTRHAQDDPDLLYPGLTGPEMVAPTARPGPNSDYILKVNMWCRALGSRAAAQNPLATHPSFTAGSGNFSFVDSWSLSILDLS